MEKIEKKVTIMEQSTYLQRLQANSSPIFLHITYTYLKFLSWWPIKLRRCIEISYGKGMPHKMALTWFAGTKLLNLSLPKVLEFKIWKIKTKFSLINGFRDSTMRMHAMERDH